MGLQDICRWVSSCSPIFTMMLIYSQLPKRIDLDRGASTFFHYTAHSDVGTFTFGRGKSDLACLLNEAKVGHAGHADCRRRPASLERFEAAKYGDAKDPACFKEKGQCGARTTLVRMVKEWEDLATLRRVRELFCSCPDSSKSLARCGGRRD